MLSIICRIAIMVLTFSGCWEYSDETVQSKWLKQVLKVPHVLLLKTVTYEKTIWTRYNEEMRGKVKFPNIELMGSLFFNNRIRKREWGIQIIKFMILKNGFSFGSIIEKIKWKLSNQAIKAHKNNMITIPIKYICMNQQFFMRQKLTLWNLSSLQKNKTLKK